ncbi:fatty acid hydroxylase domain-containing protein 2-like [Culicoides brevitarsis]|uniref:fatty acid hydroxylase domain-containing protein 2-like n=1 Tax=Culicoides brevitarsis TaxID=469753 RepID=UPI00307B35E5
MAILYWTVGFLYLIMDLTKKPNFLQKYKMNRNEVPITWPLLKEIIVTVVFNQIFVSITVSTILYPILPLRGLPPIRKMPTIPEFLFQIYGCWFLREFVFFYMHRLIHHRSLYEHVHKKHHRWTAPIALSAVYCTPAEHVICNYIPIVVGPVVFAPHYISTFYLFQNELRINWDYGLVVWYK